MKRNIMKYQDEIDAVHIPKYLYMTLTSEIPVFCSFSISLTGMKR